MDTTKKDKTQKEATGIDWKKLEYLVAPASVMVAAILLQILLIVFSVKYVAYPKDLIHEYNVTVEPQSNGSLDITYTVVWEVLENGRNLYSVEFGMPNQYYSLYEGSISANVRSFSYLEEEDEDGDLVYTGLRMRFFEPYHPGDVVTISFKVNQRNMLRINEKGYFYEFVPSWFNKIQVRNYEFTWRMPDGNDRVWTGSLDYGEYKMMSAQYDARAFEGCKTVRYSSYGISGAENGLKSDEWTVRIYCWIGVILLLHLEVFIFSEYICYRRGTGFRYSSNSNCGSGDCSDDSYFEYTSGRSSTSFTSSSIGGRSSSSDLFSDSDSIGGRSCACACACAGGGRAGCSQKDTFGKRK